MVAAGHTEWMFDDHPPFRALIDRFAGFFGDALSSTQQNLDDPALAPVGR